MKKKGFNMVEISVVISLLVLTILACVPAIFSNSRQAKIISRWKNLFAETKSNFEIFSINDYETIKNLCRENAQDKDEKIYKIISPYLNIDTEQDVKRLKNYSYRFSNGARLPLESVYFTNRFAFQENGSITGFRILSKDCSNETPFAAVVFDLNGTNGPNRLGQDVFGFHIFNETVKPFGYGLSNTELDKECKKGRGTGAVCSEFYLRGGKF